MTTLQIIVLLGGTLLLVAIPWWFFFAGTKGKSAVTSASGQQEIVVVVDGGYDPSTVHLDAGHAVRLAFERREDNPCSEEIAVPHLGLRRFLPAFKETVVELPPLAPGTHEFTCGMGMLRGRLVVSERG